MVWIYYTSISPYNNSYEEAFDIFLSQCVIDKEKLYEHLRSNSCYRFLIKTDEENDSIVTQDRRIYYKSKFMLSKKFKKTLVDYYKPLGIYVKGPVELMSKDRDTTNRWVVELSFSRYHA